MSPTGGQGPPQPGPPKSVLICTAPKGRLKVSALPASFPSSVVPAGIFITTQCHQPAPPVGASGSCTRSAKLFVSWGAPDHFNAGETFWPEQPKPLNTCSIAIGPFGRISGLTSLNRARAGPFLLAVMEPPCERAGGKIVTKRPSGRIYNAANLTFA